MAARVEHRRAPAARRGIAPRRRPLRGRARSGCWSALVAVLNVIGLVMVLSASSVPRSATTGRAWFFFERQLMWVGVGSLLLVATMRVDYRVWRRLVRAPAQSSRWSCWCWCSCPASASRSAASAPLAGCRHRSHPAVRARQAGRGSSSRPMSSPAGPTRCDSARLTRASRSLLVFSVIALLVMVQPDLGTTLVLACIVLAVLFVAGVPLRLTVAVRRSAGAAARRSRMARAYRRGRRCSLPAPVADPGNAGYQIVAVARRARVGGHVTGVGPGRQPGEVGVPPRTPTPTSSSPSSARSSASSAACSSWASSSPSRVLGVRAARRAPDRFGALLAGGHHRLGRGSGGHQHRRGRSASARHRHARCRSCRFGGSSLVDHDGGHRHPRERGAPVRARSRSDLVAGRVDEGQVVAHPFRRAAQPLLQRHLGLPAGPLAGAGRVGEQPLDLAAGGAQAVGFDDDTRIASRDLDQQLHRARRWRSPRPEPTLTTLPSARSQPATARKPLTVSST